MSNTYKHGEETKVVSLRVRVSRYDKIKARLVELNNKLNKQKHI